VTTIQAVSAKAERSGDAGTTARPVGANANAGNTNDRRSRVVRVVVRVMGPPPTQTTPMAAARKPAGGKRHDRPGVDRGAADRPSGRRDEFEV